MADPDLNLFRVFDTLIELRSVTRAAERLGLTQSAVSHALGRLRLVLDDPLFLRSANGLQPTKRAEEIAPGIREGLRQMRGALAAPMFDPAHASRRFTIAAGAYFCSLLIPGLFERLRRDAPGVTVQIVPITETLVSSIDRGTIDLALAGDISLPRRFVEEPLFVEEMVWVAAADNPLAKKPCGSAAIARAPRVALSVGHSMDVSPTASIGALHDQDFLTRPQEAVSHAIPEDPHTVYDSQTAIGIVARTDMVALVPRRVAARAQQHAAIAILSPGKAVRAFDISMFWHSKHKADAGLAWLRAMVLQASRSEDANDVGAVT